MENRKLSPRQRIALYCKGCGSDPAAPGSWRQQIGLCPMPQCALWPERPLPTKACPVTPDLLVKYGIKSGDPALEDLKAKGLYQAAASTLATAASRGPEQTNAAGQYTDEGAT